ncbi:hypothetical protein G9464_03665 [Halostella sp. JP-L12]|uniref:hypothetical protein n=1 Tax=Halostella TaxID=1843185 RepID=UPI000EF81378|nr:MULTISPECIES: hypothetical protein [Halostella]NHN46693.1 hypothetical protein [Halostella sp. JP-L12]
MTRRVPELGLLVGLVLAGSFVAAVVALEPGFLAEAESLLMTVAIALVILYPFAAFAVLRMDDPTWLLPPDPLLGTALVAAAAVGLLGAPAGPALALAVAVFLALPPAIYNAGHGGRLRSLPALPALAGSALAAVGVFGLGAAAGANVFLYGLVASAVLLLGGAYYTSRVPGRRAERRAGAVVSAAIVACLAEYVLLSG